MYDVYLVIGIRIKMTSIYIVGDKWEVYTWQFVII